MTIAHRLGDRAVLRALCMREERKISNTEWDDVLALGLKDWSSMNEYENYKQEVQQVGKRIAAFTSETPRVVWELCFIVSEIVFVLSLRF